MGLDVLTKRDDFSLNWSGVKAFQRWNELYEMPDCWEDWDGGNGVVLKYKKNKTVWEAWVKAYEEKFPHRSKHTLDEVIAGDNGALRDDNGWYILKAHTWYGLLKRLLEDKADMRMF